ncbi:unnamed protein product, partial [Boreogadus saida]
MTQGKKRKQRGAPRRKGERTNEKDGKAEKADEAGTPKHTRKRSKERHEKGKKGKKRRGIKETDSTAEKGSSGKTEQRTQKRKRQTKGKQESKHRARRGTVGQAVIRLEADLNIRRMVAGLIHISLDTQTGAAYETQLTFAKQYDDLGPSGARRSPPASAHDEAHDGVWRAPQDDEMTPKASPRAADVWLAGVQYHNDMDRRHLLSPSWRKTLSPSGGEAVPRENIWIVSASSGRNLIENLNSFWMTIKRTLATETIAMSHMLQATVSRNGMVFMSSSVLDWRPILQAWLQALPQTQAQPLQECFNGSYQDLVDFVTTAVSPKMQVLECMYIKQTIDLLQGLLPPSEEKQRSRGDLGRLFVFAVMWSLGALLELEDRAKLEAFLKGHRTCPDLPKTEEDQTIFEFMVNSKGDWEHWCNKVPEYLYPADSVPDYGGILVPNVDNVRTDFLIQTIMKQGKAVLLTGEQGTAKTVMIRGYTNKFDPELQISKGVNFSSATLPNMFQRNVESYIDKRMGTTYGPPAGKKMTVFVDDINMPIINEWGDQITNEIVRQLMEQGGFYSLDRPGEFTTVVDIKLIAAMIHPGGGRNDIPQRLKRQFSIFNCTLPSNTSIDKIFCTLAQGYFCPERGFPEGVCSLAGALVPTTRRMWQAIKAKMLPSPAKFHYIFNLRDLSRIWQGILAVKSEVCQSPEILAALFHHECSRVISDRFIDAKDSEVFEAIMEKITVEDHGKAVTEHVQWNSYFVDFLQEAPEPTGEEGEDVELDAPKVYEPIESLDSLEGRLTTFQQQYNEAVRGGAMDLVFFRDAISHLIKIARILRTPQGNALLVGVG